MKKSMIFVGILAIGFANAQDYSGNVGINTTTPSATLNVKSLSGRTTADTKNLELENGAGTKLVTVLNNGNVGIGTDNPEAKLEIAGNMRVHIPGSNYLSGKTGSNGITAAYRLSTAYFPFIRQVTQNGHVVNIGGNRDLFGFFGYDKDRTENGYDHSFLMDVSTGNMAINSNPDRLNKLYVNGSTRIQSLAGTGDRVVLADNTGVLKTGTLSVSSLAGAGNITGSGITVTDGTGASLKNVTLEIANDAITAEKIANGTITADKLAAGVIPTDTNTNIYTNNGQLTAHRTIDTNGNNLLFTGDGRVSIGGNTAAQKLDVSGNILTRGYFISNRSSNLGGFIEFANPTKVEKEASRWRIYNMTDKETDYSKYTNGLQFWAYTADGQESLPQMVISDIGNVSIGHGGRPDLNRTTIEKLEVNGAVKVGNTNNECTTENRGAIKFANDNFYGCKSTGWVLLSN